LAAFIHIPLLARDGTSLRRGNTRITLDGLVDAGEAMLIEMVKLTRQAGSARSR
jgi:pyroglutamyl-peptidase